MLPIWESVHYDRCRISVVIGTPWMLEDFTLPCSELACSCHCRLKLPKKWLDMLKASLRDYSLFSTMSWLVIRAIRLHSNRIVSEVGCLDMPNLLFCSLPLTCTVTIQCSVHNKNVEIVISKTISKLTAFFLMSLFCSSKNSAPAWHSFCCQSVSSATTRHFSLHDRHKFCVYTRNKTPPVVIFGEFWASILLTSGTAWDVLKITKSRRRL